MKNKKKEQLIEPGEQKTIEERFEATNPRAVLQNGYIYFREEDVKYFLRIQNKISKKINRSKCQN